MKKLNSKKYVFSVMMLFLVVVCYDFIVHQILLAEMYASTAEVWRASHDMRMTPMFASQFFFCMSFIFLFTRNFENKGVKEGLRFGSYIGMLLAAINLGSYSYLPIPIFLTMEWMLIAYLKCLLCGTITALAYKK